jgi:hypothetical protein
VAPATLPSTPCLGAVRVEGGEVMLGEPFIFNASNIDRFDF